MGEERTYSKRIETAQVVKIGGFLGTILTPPKDGYVNYKDDWTDARVGAKFGVEADAVMRLRLKVYGKLEPSPMLSLSKMDARIHQLEQRIARLEHDLGADSTTQGARVNGAHG